MILQLEVTVVDGEVGFQLFTNSIQGSDDRMGNQNLYKAFLEISKISCLNCFTSCRKTIKRYKKVEANATLPNAWDAHLAVVNEGAKG